ncbi:MAG: hypothetical protein K8R40_06130 [Anaerolineaceae bacterium]|nr:hypothetical protein [Anaerolineaceae bacterium]
MNAVEDIALALEIRRVQFSVWTKNGIAIQFYEALGYETHLLSMYKNLDVRKKTH